ncbi:MAG: helix-turn-helix domain-containing protein [Lentisphaerae bacterium]|nr:helix-turn-helix domain-containing protein [Lentisphaerota bacterium]MBR2873550.1 helix-turn-helix transcriptional regulator [Lentisphaeria bacterium]
MSANNTEILRKIYTASSFDLYPDMPPDGFFVKLPAPDTGLPLVIVRYGESMRYDSNWFKHINYGYCALEMILEGEMEYLSDGERHLVSNGELFLIVPGSNVRYCRTDRSKGIRKIHLIFCGPLAGVLLYILGFKQDTRIKVDSPQLIENQLRMIGSILEAPTPEAMRQGSAELYKLLLELAAFSDFNLLPDEKRLRSLIRFHDRQIKLSFANSDLEQRLSRGHSTLNKLYKKHTGLPPHRYHQRKRLSFAAELLRTTTLPVKDIAAECGFSNSKYFLVLFKKEYGLSPGKFRTALPPRSSGN